MLKTIANPTNLREAIRYFEDADLALAFVVQLRWPNGVVCVACESKDISFLKTRRIFKCRECHKQFSVKLGTIFEDSALGLDKWLPALWLLANAKNGISSYELGRALGVTQKSAWFMLHRIRLAMQSPSFQKFDGDVEVDETYVGGLAKFMHKGKGSRHSRIIKGSRGALKGKTPVVGVLKRGPKGTSRIHVGVTKTTDKATLQAHVREHVEEGANLYTDKHHSYRGLRASYAHFTVDHAYEYVRERVIHTNGLENFWSLLKRGIKGTYVSVDPFHLFRYLDEQAFRFNERGGNDGDRFVEAARRIFGKRMDWNTLTGRQNLATT
jgi:transposase-like protein